MINPEDVRDRIAAARNADELKAATAGADPAVLKRAFNLKKGLADGSFTFPLEQQEVRTGPRAADEGPVPDPAGRDYDDSVMERIAGMNGKGTSVETGLPDGEQENFAEDQGGDLVRPLTPYENKELGEAGSQPVRVGPNFLMSPRASGIADASPFIAPEPARVVKRKAGLFRSVVTDPMAGASRHSTFFDPPLDDSKVAKDGGSIWRNIVRGHDE